MEVVFYANIWAKFHSKVFGCVKCSIYDLKNPIPLIFEGLQTPHFTTIFEEIFENDAVLCTYIKLPVIYNWAIFVTLVG